jgi:hypothetical protein
MKNTELLKEMTTDSIDEIRKNCRLFTFDSDNPDIKAYVTKMNGTENKYIWYFVCQDKIKGLISEGYIDYPVMTDEIVEEWDKFKKLYDNDIYK